MKKKNFNLYFSNLSIKINTDLVQMSQQILIKALRVLVGTAALKRSNREVVS